jgi:hypothetical protein
MTAASKPGSLRKLPCRDILVRRTRFYWGEADVLGEEMGESTRGARRGMGPSACARVAEIMSGRANSQQGLTTTCKDSVPKGRPEGPGGSWSDAWARRSEEGGVTSSEEIDEVSPTLGNTRRGQRGPGHSVVSLNLFTSWAQTRGIGGRDSRGEVLGKPRWQGVYASQRLSLGFRGKAEHQEIGEPRSEPDSGNPTVRDRRGA